MVRSVVDGVWETGEAGGVILEELAIIPFVFKS